MVLTMVMHSRLLAAPSGEETAGSSHAGFILSLVPRQVRRLFIPPVKVLHLVLSALLHANLAPKLRPPPLIFEHVKRVC